MPMIVPARTDTERLLLLTYLASKDGKGAGDPKELVGPYRFEAAAVLDQGALMGAVLLTQFRSGDAEIICAGEPGWVTRGNLKAVFAWVFGDLALRRITAVVHRRNKTSRRFCERTGYKLEGVKIAAMDDGGDAFLFGMTATACNWK